MIACDASASYNHIWQARGSPFAACSVTKPRMKAVEAGADRAADLPSFQQRAGHAREFTGRRSYFHSGRPYRANHASGIGLLRETTMAEAVRPSAVSGDAAAEAQPFDNAPHFVGEPHIGRNTCLPPQSIEAEQAGGLS